jgi:hypothetical protein
MRSSCTRMRISILSQISEYLFRGNEEKRISDLLQEHQVYIGLRRN